MSKRKHQKAHGDVGSIQDHHEMFVSSPIHDRSSTFTAIFTPSVASPRAFQQQHPPFRSAQHKILAWRRPSQQRALTSTLLAVTTNKSPGVSPPTGRGQQQQQKQQQQVIYETGSDEDGERYAGKKLEKLLTEMDVQGTVVVARWYGGVLLGPVRFKWIEDSAREAITKWQSSLRDDGSGKKLKVDNDTGATDSVDDASERKKLVEILGERDSSVSVLRGLLAEKNQELKKMGSSKDNTPMVSIKEEDLLKENKSHSTVDYKSLPLSRLKQLEKARDATLGWILKQIDAVEDKIKASSCSKYGV